MSQGGHRSHRRLPPAPKPCVSNPLAAPPAALQVQLPANVDYVKLGSFKELNPLDADWYYIRAGASFRRTFTSGVGTVVTSGSSVSISKSLYGFQIA